MFVHVHKYTFQGRLHRGDNRMKEQEFTVATKTRHKHKSDFH